MRRRWETLLRRTKLSDPGNGVLTDLLAAYREPQRHYHNLEHIRECLDLVTLVPSSAEIEIAIWFHDAVYDPLVKDNEQRSANLAVAALRRMGAAGDLIADVSGLILDTCHTAPPASPAGQYLVDIDLSILGAERPRFDAFEHGIRMEYARVPDDAFRAGRSAILRSFLQRPAIYHTAPFGDRFELPARRNLEYALQRLAAAGR